MTLEQVTNLKFYSITYAGQSSQDLYQAELAKVTRGINLEPNQAEHYLERAILYLCLKAPEKAIEDLNLALALNGNNAIAHFDLGLAHSQQKNYRKAIESYSHITNENPTSYIRACINRGKAYTDLQEYQKALDNFTEAIQLIKEDEANLAAIYVNCGHCHLSLGDRLGAAEDYQKAEEISDLYADDGNIHRWQESLAFLKTVPPELLTLTITDAERLSPSAKVQESLRHNEYTQIGRANKKWQILPKRVELRFEQSEQRFKWCGTILFLAGICILLAAFSKYLIASLLLAKVFCDIAWFLIAMTTALISFFK